MFNNMFGKLGKDINLNQEALFNLANQAGEMNMQDEEQVRALVKSVASIAGRSIDPQVEEQLVSMILKGDVPKNMNDLMGLMK